MRHVEAGSNLGSENTPGSQAADLLEGMWNHHHPSRSWNFKTGPAGFQEYFGWEDALWS